MALNIKSLKEVRGLLYSIRDKWYDIGLELDLDVNILDRIRDQYSADPKVCLVEMLKAWLQSLDPPPTWDALKTALEAEPVGESSLVEKG